MATLNRYLTIEKDFDIVLTPSIDKEGGWNFLKMAAMGGLEIFTKNRGRGGARNGGGGGKFLKSLYMVGRKVLTPLFHEDPSPPILPTPLFQILSYPLSPHFSVTSNPQPHCSFCCPASLAEWGITLHMSSLGTLVPKGSWYVFYVTRCQVYWDMWFFTGTLIWYNTHKQKHTQYT